VIAQGADFAANRLQGPSGPAPATAARQGFGN
jgi:hypothetical protein